MDDNTLLLVDFGEGCFASIDATYNAVATNTPQFELYGSRGVLQISGWTRSGPALELHTTLPTGAPGWFAPTAPLDEEPKPGMIHTLQDLLHFAHCIVNDQAPIPSAAHARHVIEIIEKAYLAARTGTTQDILTTF
jgi:predicted dehydrogenase